MTEIYDIETCKSGICYVGLNVETEEISKFIIHKDLDKHGDLINHLQNLHGMIGFNNCSFDYPILHSFQKAYEQWIVEARVGFIHDKSTEEVIQFMYNKAQEIIEEQDKGTFGFNNFKKTLQEKDYFVPQLDLFKLHHFDNVARTQSLKGLEIWMNYSNVQDMPISHTKEDITLEEMKVITDYCENDVRATYEFWKLSRGKIDLRKDLNKKYNLKCLNFSDSRIGEQLTLKLYCDKTHKDMWEVRKQRTERSSINFKDIIFDYIKFQTPEFNKVLEYFKSKTITETKNSFTKQLIYKEFKYELGSGGVHGVCKEGIYQSNATETIKSCDVQSLYPSIAVLNKLYPEHLGISFCEVYEGILKDRIVAKKEGNTVLSDGYKLSLNSVYGKSNDKFSFLYDSKYTMSTTINGQLLLLILAEQLQLAGFKMLMINTDGLECIVPNDLIETYESICKTWEQQTKLSLEYVDYSKMIIRDVNNYTSITTKEKIKNKGVFVINKEYYQDPSFKIIPIALQEYFVNNVPVETTIQNHKNIYDFCGRAKFKSDSYGEIRYIGKDYTQNFKEYREKQQKTTRYFISKKGSTFIKVYPEKKKEEFINKGFQVTIFNKFEKREDYGLNYDFYIKECYKEIDQIENKQLTLLL